MTRKTKEPALAPYGEDGSLFQYTHREPGKDVLPQDVVRKNWKDEEYTYHIDGIFWRPREPFRDTLKFHDLYDGRSALGIIWTNADGSKFPMFASDFRDLMKRGRFTSLSVSGLWLVRKVGANYGVSLLEEEA